MNTPIIRSIPAASKLRKVSGFDPLAFLRLATSESGQKIVKLELPYKRLWFRMACPDGRMQLKPLHVTDAQAIYEAILYADKADAEPSLPRRLNPQSRKIRSPNPGRRSIPPLSPPRRRNRRLTSPRSATRKPSRSSSRSLNPQKPTL